MSIFTRLVTFEIISVSGANMHLKKNVACNLLLFHSSVSSVLMIKLYEMRSSMKVWVEH